VLAEFSVLLVLPAMWSMCVCVSFCACCFVLEVSVLLVNECSVASHCTCKHGV